MSESNRGNLKKRARSLSPERPRKCKENPSEEKKISTETLVDFVVSQAYKKIESKISAERNERNLSFSPPPISRSREEYYPQFLPSNEPRYYTQQPSQHPTSYASQQQPQYLPQNQPYHPPQYYTDNLQQQISNSNIPCRFHGNCKRYCTFYHSFDENRIRFLRQARVDFRIKKAFCSFIFQGGCKQSRDLCPWAHDRRDICCAKCGHIGHSEFECVSR